MENSSFSTKDLEKMQFCPVPECHPLTQHAPPSRGFTAEIFISLSLWFWEEMLSRTQSKLPDWVWKLTALWSLTTSLLRMPVSLPVDRGVTMTVITFYTSVFSQVSFFPLKTYLSKNTKWDFCFWFMCFFVQKCAVGPSSTWLRNKSMTED